MKIKTPRLKNRLARFQRVKANRISKGKSKRALVRRSALKKSEELEPRRPLALWDPLHEIGRLRRELDRLWSRWLGWPKLEREAMTMAEWQPRVEVSEDDKEYLLKAELPGVRREDVHITVGDGGLSIRGERRVETVEKSGKIHRREWSYGSFERRFALPSGTDPNKITSEFRDGLLKVRVPKSPEAKANTTRVAIR